MKKIHNLTKVFGFSLGKHKFECLETSFCFKICHLNYSLKVSCLSQMNSPYFLKVNAHLLIEILLIKEFFLIWFDEVVGFNTLFYCLFMFFHFQFLLSLLLEFFIFTLFILLHLNTFLFNLFVFLNGFNSFLKIRKKFA